MKPFTKRLALVMGLLFTALICMGVVFIDTVNNYWKFSGGFVQLVVNTNGINTNLQASFTVDTNTLRVGIKTNNTTFGVFIRGALPPTAVASSTGTSAANTGAVRADGGVGGSTTIPTTGTGGAGGNIAVNGGVGGGAFSATTNATGGAGGNVAIAGGAGNGFSSGVGVATNRTTGGAGGNFTLTSGTGGEPDTPSTNTIGGNGGAFTMLATAGGTPSAGWTRQGGAGGAFLMTAGNSGASTRTNTVGGGDWTAVAGNSGGVLTTPGNAGLPGNANLTAGNSGSAVAGGNPSPGGLVNVTAGSGATGDTNSDGGHVFIAGGAPGTGAVPGNVVLARTSGGTSRGAGVQIGPLITGGSATITNVLGAAASLDFPSTVAGTFSELAISVTGVTSNNVAVALSVPWESAQTGGGFVTFNSNDVVYVRFLNNQLVSAIDPAPGTFTVVGFRIR